MTDPKVPLLFGTVAGAEDPRPIRRAHEQRTSVISVRRDSCSHESLGGAATTGAQHATGVNIFEGATSRADC